MKKSLLIVGLMLAMSLTASAQYKGFAFGFKIGPNWGWTGSTTGGAVNEGARTGFDLGVVAEYYFADNYGYDVTIITTDGLFSNRFATNRAKLSILIQFVSTMLTKHNFPFLHDRSSQFFMPLYHPATHIGK